MTPGKLEFSTKAQAIYAHLRERIISGEAEPGERLILRQIAQDLGVSEIPVREAMKRLEAEGLVQLRPHAGATVTELVREDLVQIFQCRVHEEAFAARLAAQRATASDIARLRDLVRKMSERISAGDRVGYGRLNRDFHVAFNELCGNRYLFDTVRRLQALTERARAIFVWDPAWSESANREHATMVDLLEKRDAGALEDYVRRHRRVAFETFIAALDRVTAQREHTESATL